MRLFLATSPNLSSLWLVKLNTTRFRVCSNQASWAHQRYWDNHMSLTCSLGFTGIKSDQRDMISLVLRLRNGGCYNTPMELQKTPADWTLCHMHMRHVHTPSIPASYNTVTLLCKDRYQNVYTLAPRWLSPGVKHLQCTTLLVHMQIHVGFVSATLWVITARNTIAISWSTPKPLIIPSGMLGVG